MRLSAFISSDTDAIVARWEEFAATRLPAARSMSRLELRDHARQILEAIAIDLGTPQTRDEQSIKSRGMAEAPFDARETAAQTHAVLRARSGYDIQQLASEYRALRTSVLQSWFDACGAEEPPLGDVIRFNEAIDQALAESIAFFSAYVERSRNLLLGILGHDMRTPLQSIKMTALLLSELNAGADVSKAASRLINSGARMQLLLDDLLDFNRVQLGLGLTVAPVPVDLARICADEVEEIRAAHPEMAIELQVVGDGHGCWDPSRMHQLLANLVGNAVKYGSSATPIRVSLVGEDQEVHLRIRNSGPRVEQLETMFGPLVRGSPAQHGNDGSLGLGLYIAREIARGHGGEIEGHSDELGTVFSVRLPRQHRPPTGAVVHQAMVAAI
jgi:hypothetical protein